VTARGWLTMAAWELSISMVLACVRAAMKRSASGGMALSLTAMRYQEGMVLQAGGPERASRDDTAAGRWVAAITAAVALETSAAKMARNDASLM